MARGRDLSGAVLDGRYRVIEPIAEGAMGLVYRAERVGLGRAVAIKVLHESLPGELSSRERFEREAKLMALLEHPNCVSVIDFGLHDDKPFVVMELVRGTSLADLIVKLGRFDAARAGEILRQVLSGLAHAHGHGIIHRDIKPANIMVSPAAGLGEVVRILDFGLARLHASSTHLTSNIVVGTPSYMAPEQCRGIEIDARVDLYASGVMLFEMLTGRKPFVADDPITIVRKQLNEPPPRLADVVSEDFGPFEALVARALAKDPADRFQTAVEMSAAVDAAIASHRAPLASLAARAIPSSAIVGRPTMTATPSGWSVPQEVGSSAILEAQRDPTKPEVGSHDAPEAPRFATGPTHSRASTPTFDVNDRSAPPGPTSRKADPGDRSILKLLPRSRMRWAVLAGAIVVVAALYGILAGKKQLAQNAAGTGGTTKVAPAPREIDMTEPSAPELARIKQLLSSDNKQAALDVALKARRLYPQNADLAHLTGRAYFAKLYWTDGIKNFRDAIRLDVSYRTDAELVNTVIRGFLTTPDTDARIAGFLQELGSAAVPALEETVRDHPNSAIRARASAMLRRIRR